MSTLTRIIMLFIFVMLVMKVPTTSAAPFDPPSGSQSCADAGFFLETPGRVAEDVGATASGALIRKLKLARSCMNLSFQELPSRKASSYVYDMALIEIIDWLNVLESDKIGVAVVKNVLGVLWPPMETPKSWPTVLATKLGEEYLRIFHHYTGFDSNRSSAARLARLEGRFGPLDYMETDEIRLRTGFDWSFGRIQRGLLWLDAKANDLFPVLAFGTDLEMYMQFEELDSRVRWELIKGLAACKVQMAQGRRGPESLYIGRSLLNILRSLLPDKHAQDALSFLSTPGLALATDSGTGKSLPFPGSYQSLDQV